MYLYSDERISNMSAQDILHFMAMVHYQPIPNSSIEQLQPECFREIVHLQCGMTTQQSYKQAHTLCSVGDI